jgi:capsule polysaccharide export protein KpsE/RkpR
MPSNPMRVSPDKEVISSTVFAEPPIATYDEREVHSAFTRLRLLLDERILLFRITACGLAFGTLLAFLIPARFESRTQLMPPDSSDLASGLASMMAMSGKGGGLGMLAGDLLGLRTSGSLFIGILRSDTVEDRIIDQFNLRSVYHVKRMQEARRRLEENTQISEDRKSGIISIGVSDHSPERAQQMAEAYVTQLNQMVVELNTSAAHRERVFLEERLKAVKFDLDASAKQFSEFASKNTAIDIQEQGKAMVGAAATLQGHLIAAQSELEGLRQIYADSNVRIHAVRARIDELQKKLEQMGGGDLAGNESPEDSLYPSIRKLPLLGVTYANLYRATKIQETVFELLTQQCELAKVQEAKETPSVKILDAAKLPEKKSFPPRLVIMIFGACLSMMAGTIWILGKSSWNDLDAGHPGKRLAIDAYTRIKADLGLASGNGNRLHQVRDKILWFKRSSRNHDN